MFRASLTVVACLVAMSAAEECSGTKCAADETTDMQVSMLQMKKQEVMDQESVKALENRRAQLIAELADLEKELNGTKHVGSAREPDEPDEPDRSSSTLSSSDHHHHHHHHHHSGSCVKGA